MKQYTADMSVGQQSWTVDIEADNFAGALAEAQARVAEANARHGAQVELGMVIPGPYSQKQLKVAFDAVCDKQDWKRPINAQISNNDRDITKAAIEHYTGSEVCFIGYTNNDNQCTVWAAGYYAAIGA
jgi:hypothetical protein